MFEGYTNAMNAIKLYKTFSQLINTDVALIIVEYLEKNLWEYSHNDTYYTSDKQIYYYDNFVGYMKMINDDSKNNFKCYDKPIHFAWLCNITICCADNSFRKLNSALFIKFSPHLIVVKVNKEDEQEIRSYLRSKDLLQ